MHLQSNARLIAVCFSVGALFLLGATSEAAVPCELAKTVASGGTAADFFGYSISMDEEIAVVGAPKHDFPNFDMGAAYVFQSNGDSWVQVRELLAGDSGPSDFGDHFGWSVAVSGNTIVVGAPFDDDNGANSGSAYVYRFTGLGWVKEQKLIAGDGEAEDRFGWDVDVSGPIIVVGARGDDELANNAGSAYLFRHDGSSWIQEQKFLPTHGGTGNPSAFGASVAADGERVLVGSPWGDANGLDRGAAYVFRFNGVFWAQEQLLLPLDSGFVDWYGISVDLQGDTAIVGATHDDDNGLDSGSAYVFRFDGVSWSQEQKFLAFDGASGDAFGRAVAIHGNRAVVGAYGKDGQLGTGYLFQFSGSVWDEGSLILPSDFNVDDPLGAPPTFGLKVELSGETMLISAPYDDNGNGGDAGSTYFFDLEGRDCNENGICDRRDILDGTGQDRNGNGTLDSCEPTSQSDWPLRHQDPL